MDSSNPTPDFEMVRTPETPAAPPPQIDEASGREISPLAQARVRSDYAFLRDAGFDVDSPTFQPLYSEGTKVVESGEQKLKTMVREFEGLDTARGGAEKLRDACRAERRIVLPNIPLTGFEAASGGALHLTADGTRVRVWPTRTGWKNVADRLVPEGVHGAGQYFASAPPHVRALNVNQYVEDLRAGADDRRANVGVKLFDGKRPVLAYRFGSTAYTPFEVPDACDALLSAEALAPDARMEVFYDGERARLLVLFHADEVVDLACGDIFKVGVIIKLSDAIGSSTEVTLCVWRNRCLNLIIIGKATKTVFKQRHTGANIRDTFTAAVAKGQATFATFRDRWNAARKEKLFNSVNDEDGARRAFAGLLGAGLIELPGRDPEAKLQKLMVAWQKEPGYSRADMINAVTRAVHEGTWWNNPVDGSEEVEEQAGKLLYVRNLINRVDAGATAFAEKYEIELT